MQPCLLTYLPDGALLQRLPRVQLAFWQIPLTPAQHHQDAAFVIAQQAPGRLHQVELLPESLPQLFEVVMNKDAGMHLWIAHLMDHGIDSGMGEVVDQHRIVVMRIGLDLIGHPVAEKKGFLVKVDLEIHASRLRRFCSNLPTFAVCLKRSSPPTSVSLPKSFSRCGLSSSTSNILLAGRPAGKAPSIVTTAGSWASPMSGIL